MEFEFGDYALPSTEGESIVIPTCSLCLDNIEDDIYCTGCNHFYHKECIKNFIVHEINNDKSNITCPKIGTTTVKCGSTFLHKDIAKIVNDNNLMDKLKLNYIKNDDKCRICPACEKSYYVKTNNNWVTTCTKCKENICFNCNKKHDENISCFDVDEEMKNAIDDYYKNSSEILKICDHCGIPQEKISGCNHMKCGSNHSASSDTEQNVRHINGCGRAFNWDTAKVYKKINEEAIFIAPQIITNGPDYITREMVQLINHDMERANRIIENREREREIVRNRERERERERNREKRDCCFCNLIFHMISISLIALFIFGIIYYTNITNKIYEKNDNEKHKFCDTEFNNVDPEYYLNTTCLNGYNITINEYDSEYGANTNNIYYENCLDEEAYEYGENCDLYKEFDYLRYNYDADPQDMCGSGNYFEIIYRCVKSSEYSSARVLAILSIIFVSMYGFAYIAITAYILIVNCYDD